MNGDSDHSTRSSIGLHGVRESSHYKPQHGCFSFEESTLTDYQLKTYLPQESPTLNPLLAIASHQWFDRLFNPGPPHQSLHRPTNERRYLLATQTPDLGRSEYEMAEESVNVPNLIISKNVDKRVSRYSTMYKHPFLHAPEAETRNYANSHAGFSSTGVEAEDQQLCPVEPFSCRARLSRNKLDMCDSNSVFGKPPSEQFPRNPFIENVGEDDVRPEDRTDDAYKLLSVSSGTLPEFTQKALLSYPSQSCIEDNTASSHQPFSEVDGRETVFGVISSTDGTLARKSPDVHASSCSALGPIMSHVMVGDIRTAEQKVDEEPTCSPGHRKEDAVVSPHVHVPNLVDPVNPTVTQNDMKSLMYQVNLSTCDVQPVRMVGSQLDWNESRHDNDDQFHSSPSDEGETNKGNNLLLGFHSYATHTGPPSLDWHQDNSGQSKVGTTHMDDWSGSSADLNSSETFPVMNVLPCISQGLFSSFTNPYSNQPPAMGNGDSQSFPMHTSHCTSLYSNPLENYPLQPDSSVLPHQFNSLPGQSIRCAPLLGCPTDPNTVAAAAMATNFPNTFNYHMLPPVGGLMHSNTPTTSQSHSTSYQTNRSRVGAPSFPPNILTTATGGPYVQRAVNNSYSLSAAPAEVDYNPRELEAFSELFKQRRIKLGVTQADVGKALGNLKIAGVGSLSQSTICRFESLTLSHNNMVALKPVLQAWLDEAEADAAERSRHPEIYDPEEEKRRKRTSITDSEKRSLEAFFSVQPRPSSEKISQIAEKLNLRKNVVRVWFCNQRQKQKRMKFSTLGLLHHTINRS